ncbi:hypothetical protein J7T55_007468 [Diaporthe amygdali]|uniref:uncharacterized protein n=1 Tax=Phomopsis amygdali TaxID=1214568 RepID=UPI0022FE7D52|nr:uncharacterized protein J7T55_007468 [Diaporthe amygdali]KAJ0116488.1 hypothetical protein J7T55_007468 [Diaporthe amygdali]
MENQDDHIIQVQLADIPNGRFRIGWDLPYGNKTGMKADRLGWASAVGLFCGGAAAAWSPETPGRRLRLGGSSVGISRIGAILATRPSLGDRWARRASSALARPFLKGKDPFLLPDTKSPQKMVNRAAAKLRAQLADKDNIIVCPGVQDGLSARVCLDEGFQNLYMTGAGTAMSVLGMPDLGLTTVDDMTRNAGMIAGLDRTVPVIADADTGFGGPLMVARTVEKYVAAGVAGLHIEDQVATKRCGHLLGKELVDLATYVARIRAAAAAREALGDDIVIIARTDALQSLGFDAAIERLRAAVEAGADVAFLEGMTSKEQMAACVEAMAPTPCFLNMVVGGVTPLVDRNEAKRMGYRIVIWPIFSMTAALLAYREAAKELKELGMNKEKRNEKGELLGGVRECFEICGLTKYSEFDKAMGGQAFSKGV